MVRAVFNDAVHTRLASLGIAQAPAMRYRFGKILAFDCRVTYGAYVSKPEFRLISERTL